MLRRTIKGNKLLPLNFKFTQKIKMADDEENNNKRLIFVIIVKTNKT